VKQISKRKIQVLSLLAVPAIAIAMVAFLGGGLGSTSHTPKVSAANPGTDFDMNIRGTNCNTNNEATSKCNLSVGQKFVVEVVLVTLPTGVTSYAGFDVDITHTGVTGAGDPAGSGKAADSSVKWPNCVFAGTLDTPGTNRFGCAIGAPPAPLSTFTGPIGTISLTCTASGAINLVAGASDTDVDGAFEKGLTGNKETINVNCLVPTNTATITPTFTPTNTPTNTPTATPPPVPRWMKQQRYPFTNAPSQCDPNAPVNDPCHDPQDPALDNLGNLWLTRQGAKIPPLNCQQSSDNAVFSEVLQFTPHVPDPKLVHPFAYIGGFEFEVHFNPKLICVNLVPGAAATDLGLICFIDDKANGQPLEGIARMGCVTKGKNKRFPPNFKTKGPELAQVWVKPQPELYSQVRPNQDNGVVAQLLDSNCELSDEQGHPIPIFSCEDAEVTVRYLEGDVEPNCRVDAADQQNVAFRWGASLGSLLYNTRYDLEPSGTVKGDGDVDIKDLQFVFGRFNSSCGRQIDNNLAPVLKPLPTDTIGSPHPRQAPRNAKS
jgi:hypothetical protein